MNPINKEKEFLKLNSDKLTSRGRISLFLKYLMIYLFVPMIGTLMHELGHFLPSIAFGYYSIIHYDSCSYNCGNNCNAVNSFIITLGGPVATWLECLIPFTILALYYKKDIRQKFDHDLPPLFVVLFIFSTFCTRFVFNTTLALFRGFQGDEGKISRTLELFPGTFDLIFAGIALIILFYLLFMLPINIRFTIVYGAVSGSLLGYYLWYYQIGPLLLPR